MNRPRILIIENSIDVTGALKSITCAAIDLKEYFDFQFVIPKGSRSRVYIERKGFSVIHELPMKELSRRFLSLALYLPYLLLNFFLLRRIIKRERINLVHVNDLYNLLPAVYKIAGSRVPYICHTRFLPDKFPPFLFNFWLKVNIKYAVKIIAVSHALIRNLPRHSNIIVIHNELPTEERHPEMVLSNMQKDNYTFLYLSNFIQGKGQNFALEAFAKVHSQLPAWKLRFVGGDLGLPKNQEFRANLQQRAKELGIFEKTEWLGFTEDVEMEYKGADIILNFSESESFSITCLEALFFGRPVIATDCGGPSEIIEDKKTGYLVANRNTQEMAFAMLNLGQNFTERLNMGLLARSSVRVKFGKENTSLKIREEYDVALDRA